MFGSDVLEIAIGLVLTYALLALLSTAMVEFVSRFLGKRSKTLEQGIRNLLDDPAGIGLAREFYSHPLIKGFGFNRGRRGFLRKAGKPSYIEAKHFATVLFDTILPPGSKSPNTFNEVRDAASAIPGVEVRRELLNLIDAAEGNLAQARKNVEEWFDAGMDRVSGWYKRNIQIFALVAAVIVTVGLNADTIVISDSLANDPTNREAIVAAAEFLTSEDFRDEEVFDQKVTETIDELGLEFGWFRDGSFEPYSEGQRWYGKAIGLLITAIAVSLGAPFWFDTLAKLGSLRAAGRPPQKAAPS